MVILKTVKASTLMETLVASVLTVVIFMVSSLILNNLFGATVNHQTGAIENRLYELEYLSQHHKLSLPYYEDFKTWQVSIEIHVDHNRQILVFEALNTSTQTTIHYKRYDRH